MNAIREMPSMTRNALYGLLGFAVPMGATLVTYPVLLHYLGPATFGVYLLGTAIGSMALLDLGFSSGIAKHLAEDIARGDRRSAGELIATGLLSCAVLGCVGALAIWVASPWLASLFVSEPTLQQDAVWVFRLVSFQFVAFLLILGLLSLFKGMQRFDHSTLVLSSLAVLTYGGATAGVLLAGAHLLGITVISVVGHVATLCLAGAMAQSLCRSQYIDLARARPTLRSLRRLARFGSFAALNNIAPVLSRQVQRAVIGALIGPTAVAIFASGTTMASAGFSAIRSASEVIMPATSSAFQQARTQRLGYEHLRRLYVRGLLASSALGLAAMVVLFFSAPVVIPWWLGSDIAEEVVPVVRILCVGMALNSARLVPYHTINGLGKPEFNTAFALGGPIGTFGLVLALALDGLSVRDFAIAFSTSLSIMAIAQVLFTELFVWRRWMPGALAAQQPASAVA